jgi:hypothetical protein
MEQLDETSRVYSHPNITRVGTDLVLTTRAFFVILTESELNSIINKVIHGGKTIQIHKDSIIVYMKDGEVVLEQMNKTGFNRILIVNPKKLVG